MEILAEYTPDEEALVACTAPSEAIRSQSSYMCDLLDGAVEVLYTDDGVRVCVVDSRSRRHDLVAWIERERSCCAFLRYRLTAENGLLTLEIGGGTAAQQWLTGIIER